MQHKHYSKKREAIINAVRSTTSHPTAAWVYDKLKPVYPDLSLGTVYRNLQQFKADGTIASVGVFNGQEHFDGNTSPHTHFVCSVCGNVIDLPDISTDQSINKVVSSRYGLSVNSHTLCFHGICNQCLNSDIRYKIKLTGGNES